MKKGLALVAFAFMSLLTAGSAFAGPFGRFRAPHQQQQRSGQQEDAREGDKEHNEKNNPNAQQPAAHEGGDARQGGPQPGPGRAGARMSVEDRQKLRRQINEAGRSLYTPPTGNK